MSIKLAKKPAPIFLKFPMKSLLINKYKSIGKIRITEVYLTRKATVNIGKTRYKYLEFFHTPITSKYTTQIENETPGTSIPPETAHEYIKGKERKIKQPTVL